MLASWLGLQSRRDTVIFALSIGCVAICVAFTALHAGHARAHLLFAAFMAAELGCLAIGRRWRYLTKTPRQMMEDRLREGVRMGFAERLLSLLAIVLGALSIYAHYVA